VLFQHLDSASVLRLSACSIGLRQFVRSTPSLRRQLLTDEQWKMAKLAIIDRQSLYLGGGGGCGKTHWARFLQYYFEQAEIDFITMAPSAQAAQLLGGYTVHQACGLLPTGTSRPGLAKPSSRFSNTTMGGVELIFSWTLKKQLQAAKIIFWDEICMSSMPLFDAADFRLRQLHRYEPHPDRPGKMRMSQNGNKPFGGVQIIGLGDALQLPPPGKDGTDEAKFCFESPQFFSLFKPENCFKLTRPMRQLNDPAFAEMLAMVRMGRCPPEVQQMLRTRIFMADAAPDTAVTPYIFSRKEEAAEHNRRCLEALDQKPYTWHADDHFATDEMQKLFEKNLRFEKELVLKKRVLVILTKNYNVAEGFVNGTPGVMVGVATTCELALMKCNNPGCDYCMGRAVANTVAQIMKFKDDASSKKGVHRPLFSRFLPVIRFNDRDDQTFAVMPATDSRSSRAGHDDDADVKNAERKTAAYAIRQQKIRGARGHEQSAPTLVKASPGTKRRDQSNAPPSKRGPITDFFSQSAPALADLKNDDDDDEEKEDDTPLVSKIMASRRQLPLVVAFGFTIHKVQGMTMPRVAISWDRVFAPGQIYVALSRATALGGVYIVSKYPNWVPVDRIKAAPAALEFDNKLN